MRPVPQSCCSPWAWLLVGALALAGCLGNPPPQRPPAAALGDARQPPESPPERAPEPAAPETVDARAEAPAVFDVAAERAALDARVSAPLLEACAEHLRAGRVAEAGAVAEDALSTSPDLDAALFLAGACRAELGRRADDDAAREAALDLLARARGCSGALASASALARELGHLEEALELARAGLAPSAGPCAEVARVVELVDAHARDVESPERALALAALEAWRERREAQPAAAAKLFEEAEDALQLAFARDDGDAWAWLALGQAYLEAGRYAEARVTLENGVDRLDDVDALLDPLARAARREGGTAEVVSVFARVQARRPSLGLAWWHPGLEQFEAAARGAADPRRLYHAAERALATCRVKDPAQAPRCLRYEALCRAGRGWSWLAEGDLERAWNEFRAAGEPLEGGLRLEHPPLASARAGLEALIERHLSRGELSEAARAAERLADDSPDDPAAVRRAAELARDLGDRLHLLERDLKLAGRGDLYDPVRMEELRVVIGTSRPGDDLRGTEREKDKFFERGDRFGREALDTYLRALGLYRRAIALAPDDLRLGWEASAVVVRRLDPRASVTPAEVDWAEAQLLRLVEVGRRSPARASADSEASYAFEEAWGDVHQLLGELYLAQRDDPSAARRWFEACLAIGPVPRSEVSEKFLPRCLEEERRRTGGRR